MESTCTLARSFGVTPFEIMAQDTDEVLMVLAFYAEKAEDMPDDVQTERPAKAPRSGKNDGFWDF